MLSSVALLLLLPTFAEPEGLTAGTRLTYRGRVSAPEKTFDLTLLVGQADAQGAVVYWSVDENGRGQWPWADRFGVLSLDPQWKAPTDAVGPSVVYEYDGGSAAVPIELPFLANDGLAVGKRWEAEGLDFEVERETTVADVGVWQVESRDNVGRRRVMYREKTSPLLLGVDQQVFMNMGTEYQLALKIVDRRTLPAEDLDRLALQYKALISLRDKLKRPARNMRPDLTEPQLSALAAGLPAAQKVVDDGPLLKILRTAEGDLKQQTDRVGGVAKLAEKFVGQTAPAFESPLLTGETLKSADLKGSVVVLHFWDYRHEPLEEPYGQVGYLDFLNGKRGKDGVKVVGLAVDDRLADEAGRGEVLRGARKFKAFMRLSYPVGLDSDGLVKKLGDPQSVGAKLPLFVVLDRSGRIVHYHAGFYPIDRDRGLKPLDSAIDAALKAPEEKK